MMGLAGKNGAGKTTLVHYIIDEKYDFDGEILVDGKSVKAQHREVLDRIHEISTEYRNIADLRLYNLEGLRDAGIDEYLKYMHGTRLDLFYSNKANDNELNIKTFYLK